MSENKIGLNVRIYHDVIIRDSELCDNVLVPDDAFIKECKIEENVIVERRSMLFNSKIGAYTTLEWDDVVRNAVIGKYCSLVWNCTVGGAEHYLHRLSTSFFPLEKRYGIIAEDTVDPEDPYAKPVEIGNDVWIAADALVLKKMKVGDGAVLGGGLNCYKGCATLRDMDGSPGKENWTVVFR